MSNSLMPQYAYVEEPYWVLQTVTVDRQPHPVLVEARQTAPNQILITYDQRSDLASATNVSNYWIRSNMGPAGIASVGMPDIDGY